MQLNKLEPYGTNLHSGTCTLIHLHIFSSSHWSHIFLHSVGKHPLSLTHFLRHSTLLSPCARNSHFFSSLGGVKHTSGSCFELSASMSVSADCDEALALS